MPTVAGWLTVYHSLPTPLRQLAVTMRGHYLRRWRYGPETQRLVEEALERDTWTPQRWRAWQEERLASLLHRAATCVPYYREHWRQRRMRGDRASWEVLNNWPILTKAMVQQHARAFIADDADPRSMFCDRTSGTTGTPLAVFSPRETLRKWYALNEARLRLWHGISWGERWAILGGQMVVPIHRRRPPFWVFNPALNQLYLSTFHIAGHNAEWYVRALRQYAPSHIIAYPSSLASLAGIMLDSGLRGPDIKVVLSNAEALPDNSRQAIARAFRCPVRNTYGMAEMVAGASECDRGTMHLWPEAGRLEILGDDEDRQAPAGQTGRVVATGLLNPDMPLIRYETGDRGALRPEDVRCSCGRGLPALAALEGRSADMIVTADGRRIFWLNPAFYGLQVREAQLIQESLERIRVLCVVGPGHTPQDEAILIGRLRERIGNIEVVLQRVEQIPRSANGKFKPVISHVLPPTSDKRTGALV